MGVSKDPPPPERSRVNMVKETYNSILLKSINYCYCYCSTTNGIFCSQSRALPLENSEPLRREGRAGARTLGRGYKEIASPQFSRLTGPLSLPYAVFFPLDAFRRKAEDSLYKNVEKLAFLDLHVKDIYGSLG